MCEAPDETELNNLSKRCCPVANDLWGIRERNDISALCPRMKNDFPNDDKQFFLVYTMIEIKVSTIHQHIE